MADLVTKLLLYTNNFDTNIEKASRKMSRLSQTGSRVSAGLGKLGGVVTKFAGALGVAATAGSAVETMFTHNDKLADAYGRAMNQAKTATQGFLTSLASGNVAGFLSNLGQITQSARECYDAFDNLNTYKFATDFELSAVNAAYQVQLNLAKDRTLSEKERLTYLERAREIMGRQTRIMMTQLQLTKAAYEAQWRDSMNSYGAFGTKAEQDRARTAVENWSSTGDAITNMVTTYDNTMRGFNATITSLQAKMSGGHSLTTEESAQYRAAMRGRQQLEERYGNERRLYGGVIDMVNNPDEGVMKALEMRKNIDSITVALSNAALELDRTEARITGGHTAGPKGKTTGGKVDASPAAGSLAWYDERISQLQKQAKGETNIDKIVELNNEIARLTAEKETLQLNINLAGWDKVEADLKAKGIALPGTSAQQAATSKLNIGFDAEAFRKKMDADFKQLTIEAPKIDLGDGKQFSRTVDAINAVGAAIEALNADFEMSAAGILKWVSTLLSAASQAVKAIIAVTAAKSAESAADTPVVGWLLAAGAAASVLSALTALCSFAEGGIVGGARTAGDATLVRANAGEMIINRGQQARLFRMIDGGGIGQPQSGRVVFEIQGDRLRGLLDNHDRKAAKYS